MRLLVVDTCLAVCQAAVFEDLGSLGEIAEPMIRGHQERLAPMADEVMALSGLAFTDLDRIVVTVGPGSFTGLRVGLAFAKGLALALGRPCVGVGTLAALAASLDGEGPRAAVIDAGRGGVYLQDFEGERALGPPENLPLKRAAARLSGARARPCLVGPGASCLAPALGGGQAIDIAAPAPAAIARLGAQSVVSPPAPLYLRPPDAKVPVR